MPTPLGSQPAPQQPNDNPNNSDQNAPVPNNQAQPNAGTTPNNQIPNINVPSIQPNIPKPETTPTSPATPAIPTIGSAIPKAAQPTIPTIQGRGEPVVENKETPAVNQAIPSNLVNGQQSAAESDKSPMTNDQAQRDPITQTTEPPTPTATPQIDIPTTESQVKPKQSLLEKYIPSLAKLLNLFKRKKKTETQNDIAKQTEEKKIQLRSKKPPFLKRFISFFKKPAQAMAQVDLAGTLKLSGSKERSMIERFFTFLVTKKDKLFFLDQLSTLISSDINLIDGLRLLKQQSNKRAMKKLLDHMIKDIEAGSVLSQSMMKYPRVFPRMWTHLIKAGEESGQLAEILRKLNAQQTEQAKLMGSIKGALVYPSFIVIMMIVLTVVMMTTIVPQIQQIYDQANVDLPLPTQIVIQISGFVVNSGAVFAAAVVGVIMLIITGIKRVYFMGKIWDWLNLRWPVFGDLNKKRNLILFADNVQLLLGSGILLTDALTIAADIVPSVGYTEEILLIKDKIMKGENMSKAMGLIDVAHEKFEPNFFFPLEFAQMINVGEQTGNTNSVLDKVKNTYSEKVSNTVKNLSTLLEPIMIILVGGMVAVFLLAIMLPFFGLGKVARGL